LDLPDLFTTAGEESFARRSIRDRHAATLLQVIDENQVQEPYRSRLLDFRAESLGGKLTDPFSSSPGSWNPALFEPRELDDWRLAIRPMRGRSWYDLPWYFAESFWFLKLLFAFGYYEPEGPNRLRDPFEPLKRRELLQPGGGLEAASGLGPLLAGPADAAAPARAAEVGELLLASLWGNRMDLSMHALAREYRGEFRRNEERRSRGAARHGCRPSPPVAPLPAACFCGRTSTPCPFRRSGSGPGNRKSPAAPTPAGTTATWPCWPGRRRCWPV